MLQHAARVKIFRRFYRLSPLQTTNSGREPIGSNDKPETMFDRYASQSQHQGTGRGIASIGLLFKEGETDACRRSNYIHSFAITIPRLRSGE